MNGKLQKVAAMIKKTFHTKDQEDCFDGCVLYIEENCSDLRVACMKKMDIQFDKISGKLDEMAGNIKDIKTEIGLNGKS